MSRARARPIFCEHSERPSLTYPVSCECERKGFAHTSRICSVCACCAYPYVCVLPSYICGGMVFLRGTGDPNNGYCDFSCLLLVSSMSKNGMCFGCAGDQARSHGLVPPSSSSSCHCGRRLSHAGGAARPHHLEQNTQHDIQSYSRQPCFPQTFTMTLENRNRRR